MSDLVPVLLSALVDEAEQVGAASERAKLLVESMQARDAELKAARAEIDALRNEQIKLGNELVAARRDLEQLRVRPRAPEDSRGGT